MTIANHKETQAIRDQRWVAASQAGPDSKNEIL